MSHRGGILPPPNELWGACRVGRQLGQHPRGSPEKPRPHDPQGGRCRLLRSAGHVAPCYAVNRSLVQPGEVTSAARRARCPPRGRARTPAWGGSELYGWRHSGHKDAWDSELARRPRTSGRSPATGPRPGLGVQPKSLGLRWSRGGAVTGAWTR